MPRKGRIDIAGKWERIAAEERERALRDLVAELRAERKHSKAAGERGTSN